MCIPKSYWKRTNVYNACVCVYNTMVQQEATHSLHVRMCVYAFVLLNDSEFKTLAFQFFFVVF